MILLSFDTEEFDVPREHGVEFSLDEAMKVSIYGTCKILDCLQKNEVKATFFCTTNFAENAPLVMQRIIDEGHEVAAHGCDHWHPQSSDVRISKATLERLTKTTINGYRQPRMFPVSDSEIENNGYIYNSSLNPAFIPGRYMHLTEPRTCFMKGNVLQIPASVTPLLRFPLFWLSCHNLPIGLYLWMIRRVLRHDGYFVTYFHPWEFFPLGEHPEFKMPFIIKNHAGDGMVKRLDILIKELKRKGYPFMTYNEFAGIKIAELKTKKMIRLAIVCPCYNEEAVLRHSAEQLTALLDDLATKRKITSDSFVLLVNDGSKDSTWQIIRELHSANPYIKGINLLRNVGHQNAIMAGMMTAKKWSDAVITMDVDLQDDLQAIERMIDLHAEGYDIVYGIKVQRKADPALKRLSAMAFYKLQKQMGVENYYNHADFRLLSKRALCLLAEYQERNLYLRGIIPLLGLPSTTVDDTIKERTAGVSKYTLKKMLNLALDGITSFSVKPIYCIVYSGGIFILISIFIGFYVLYSLVSGTAEHGWASLMLSIWFVGGAVLVSIGCIGVYIGKIYKEVKHRPLYNIEEILYEHKQD